MSDNIIRGRSNRRQLKQLCEATRNKRDKLAGEYATAFREFAARVPAARRGAAAKRADRASVPREGITIRPHDAALIVRERYALIDQLPGHDEF